MNIKSEKKEGNYFNLKDVIYICVILLGFAAQYFTTQATVRQNREKVITLEKKFEQNNYELMNYKIDELSKKVESVIISVDDISDRIP